MTELQFLIHLLLEHKLPAATKKLLADRIGDVESRLSAPIIRGHVPVGPMQSGSIVQIPPRTGPIQPASTQKILDEMAAELQAGFTMATNETCSVNAPIPVTVIAQTPAAAAALNQRNQAIAIATSGKTEAGRTSPRKF